ncbi:MAG: DUF1343 domain-containing protein [Gemmataceae bacterium]|nr:DUF1343 domain-containing protein [Gemmataceae bacterium]
MPTVRSRSSLPTNLAHLAIVTVLCSTLPAGLSAAAEKPLPAAAPQSLGVSAEILNQIDETIHAAIKRGELPGAVVLIVHRGKVIFRKAYGQRSLEQEKSAMLPEIVFDLASLTKPIATATAIMMLIEQGKLRLADLVSDHVRGMPFQGAKITIEHLLTHTSGLIADNALKDYQDGRAKALERVYALKPTAEPGTKFIYSDVGFIVLGDLVERLSGEPLEKFTRKRIFEPLGMNETGFKPQGKLKDRAAPTEIRDGQWMQGEVHDPRSHLMGGVAGHAGLFSTADDLAVYAQMILQGGDYNGRRLLKPETVKLMTAPRPVPGGKTPVSPRPEGEGPGVRGWQRGLGWDMLTSYSANRGTIFPPGKSFGHTGFTGTSIWLDPDTETAVIFLSNRVHPNGKGNVTKLRGQVATLAASALPAYQARKTAPVLPGIDVLVKEKFERLKGRRIGLVTNHTGRDRQGRATIDLLHQARGVTLVALFSPEHGIRGILDEKVGDTKDEKTGLPIYSLYGSRRRPTADTLQGIDTLVYDIQDIGCRFYTYITTLGYVLESAAEHKIKVVVLDRPNPIGGVAIEGPIRDADKESFVAYHALPIRHGLTVGELARLFNAERKIDADLEVVQMQGWKRSMLLDRTGLSWVNPSPNMRSLSAALLYPGIGILETTNISVGRGTERPFEWIGAPWLDGVKLAAALAEQKLSGVRFVPAQITPKGSVHNGKLCGGVHIFVDDWARFEPVRTGLAIAYALRKLYPDDWKIDRLNVLLVHEETWKGIDAGTDWRELEGHRLPELARFARLRKKYLIYGD